jgi:hypothetical protein
MHPILTRAVVALLLVCGGALIVAFSTGPLPAKTGAFKVANKNAEPTCIQCHTGGPGLNPTTGLLQILDVPKPYSPGASYPIRVRLQNNWDPMPETPLRWGFELQAVRKATGDSAGIWTSSGIAPNVLQIKPGMPATQWENRRYIQHTFDDIHQGETGPVEWQMTWTAPMDTGTVYFFAAGNAANGDEVATLSGAVIFTAVDSSYAGTTTGVLPELPPARYATSLTAPFPNPMSKCSGFDFTIARAGFVDLAVYDVQGRRVQTIIHENREAGSYGSLWNGRRDDMSWAPNGMYFIRLKASGEPRAISQKITLAR